MGASQNDEQNHVSPPAGVLDQMPPPAVQPIIRIPDTLVNWPWPRTASPYYEQCKAESTAWFESFKAFSPKAQKAFNRCDFSRLSPGYGTRVMPLYEQQTGY